MKKIILLSIVLSLTASSCRKYDGKEAAQQREDWKSSLSDSISNLSKAYSEDSVRLITLREDVARQIESFTTVDNPREVEAYYIYTPFKGKYPLTGAGVAARLLKNEALELVAASKARFSAIRVTAGGESAETEVVPPDQALNYTANGLTTVAFTGAKADSVAMLVANHAGEQVKVEYLNPGVVATLNLPADAREMIGATWKLYDEMCQSHLAEKSMGINSRKIEILRMTIAREEK